MKPEFIPADGILYIFLEVNSSEANGASGSILSFHKKNNRIDDNPLVDSTSYAFDTSTKKNPLQIACEVQVGQGDNTNFQLLGLV